MIQRSRQVASNILKLWSTKLGSSSVTGHWCFDTSSDTAFGIAPLQKEWHKLQSVVIIYPSINTGYWLPCTVIFKFNDLHSRKRGRWNICPPDINTHRVALGGSQNMGGNELLSGVSNCFSSSCCWVVVEMIVWLTTRFPMTRTIMKTIRHIVWPETSMQSHMVSIHSPHKIRKMMRNAWKKSFMCQRGSSQSSEMRHTHSL